MFIIIVNIGTGSSRTSGITNPEDVSYVSSPYLPGIYIYTYLLHGSYLTLTYAYALMFRMPTIREYKETIIQYSSGQ